MPLDEGSGSAAKDFSANGFEGEVMGNAKWIDGKFGQALQIRSCRGTTSLLKMTLLFTIEGAITQAAWVQLDRLPSAHAHYLRHSGEWYNSAYRGSGSG